MLGRWVAGFLAWGQEAGVCADLAAIEQALPDRGLLGVLDEAEG
ncbi:MAG: hypothetical protein R3F62_11305 [Planctomycetota bacterium]